MDLSSPSPVEVGYSPVQRSYGFCLPYRSVIGHVPVIVPSVPHTVYQCTDHRHSGMRMVYAPASAARARRAYGFSPSALGARGVPVPRYGFTVYIPIAISFTRGISDQSPIIQILTVDSSNWYLYWRLVFLQILTYGQHGTHRTSVGQHTHLGWSPKHRSVAFASVGPMRIGGLHTHIGHARASRITRARGIGRSHASGRALVNQPSPAAAANGSDTPPPAESSR